MKKHNFVEEPANFFLELPPADYLTDIEIQDDYETTGDFTIRGLSAEQVSQIAADSLKDAKQALRKSKLQADPGTGPSIN